MITWVKTPPAQTRCGARLSAPTLHPQDQMQASRSSHNSFQQPHIHSRRRSSLSPVRRSHPSDRSKVTSGLRETYSRRRGSKFRERRAGSRASFQSTAGAISAAAAAAAATAAAATAATATSAAAAAATAARWTSCRSYEM